MKSKVLVSGNDGHRAYEPGDELTVDSEHHRSLIANDLAEPLDEAAQKVAADPRQRARYATPALEALAAELRGDKPKKKR
jgi:hypothetical protein